jgi:RimJ/RimL family protein N-acetyltransferase
VRAVELICEFLRTQTDVETARLVIDEGNVASHAVAARTGFVPAGRTVGVPAPGNRFLRRLR